MMPPLAIRHFTATTAVGNGNLHLLAALRAGRSGLRRQRFENSNLESWIGVVDDAETPLPAEFASWDCRNHRIAMLALAQDGFTEAAEALRDKFGSHRVGVFLGTSTSGVLHTEHAYREVGEDGRLPAWFDHRHSQNVHAPARLVASTACA
jgi:3-oxoacyl-[acyl-carrier-protein] synthase-1